MEFRILGPLELVENGRQVKLAGSRQRTLLALLRIDALGGGSQQINVGEIPYSVTVGLGAVWVTDLVDEPGEGFAPPGRCFESMRPPETSTPSFP